MLCHVKIGIDFQSVALAEKVIGRFICLQGHDVVPASGYSAYCFVLFLWQAIGMNQGA